MNEYISSSERWFRFKQLIEVIKYQSRFVLQEPNKSLVDSIIQLVLDQFNSVIPAGSKLYRARINETSFESKDDKEKPFPPEKMGPPPNHLATSGRINPEGISYLYCADESDTAGAELRPWKGAYLTIGEVELKQDVPIVDLTKECKDISWAMFYYDFSDMFSIQWPPELKLNYLVTQYFSEHFKSIGFRGIKYKSAFNNGGINYSLFYKEDYVISETYCIETTEINYFFYKRQNA
jgi:hypothetical protein